MFIKVTDLGGSISIMNTDEVVMFHDITDADKVMLLKQSGRIVSPGVTMCGVKTKDGKSLVVRESVGEIYTALLGDNNKSQMEGGITHVGG